MKALNIAILAALTIVFLAAGIDKIFHYEGFLNALRNYVVVPRGTASILGPAVIAAELLVGVGLLVPSWRRDAAIGAALLLALFTAATATNHLLGGRGICGCWFTVTLAEGTAAHVIQNLMFLVLAVLVFWDERTSTVYRLPESSGASIRP